MKKKIIVIISIILILAICISLGIAIYIKKRDEKVSLIKENVVIEYGTNYNPELKELINLNEFNFINENNTKIDSEIKNEKDKEYPGVGNYIIKVCYKDRELIQNVEVQDTTVPELSMSERIDIENGIDINSRDFKQYAKATDLSELKDYKIDIVGVDTNKAGEYNAKISVEDIYGNISEKEFKIVVPEKVEPVVEEKEDKEEIAEAIETNQNNNRVRRNYNKESTSQFIETPSTTIVTQTTNAEISDNDINNNEQKENTETQQQPIWCDEGGPKHWQGNGPNDHRLL